jgi:hypothetical protein
MKRRAVLRVNGEDHEVLMKRKAILEKERK